MPKSQVPGSATANWTRGSQLCAHGLSVANLLAKAFPKISSVQASWLFAKATHSQDSTRESHTSCLDSLRLVHALHNRTPWTEIMLQQIVEETNPSCTPLDLDRIPDLRTPRDPDAALVETLKARTPAAFDHLVKQYGCRLFNVAMRITKNREDAEDVVQESFLKVFKNIDGFRACSKFSTWLTRIVINQALMMIRGNTQKFVSFDESTEIEDGLSRPQTARYTPEQLCAQHEFENVVLDLTNVRKSSRPVMELHVNDGLSEVEISQVLSLTLSAVKARLYRGRLDLRAAIGRRFRSTKLAWTSKKMSPAAVRGSNLVADILPEAHLAHDKGKPKHESSWTSASGLAGDNPLTAEYSQSSREMESCLPDQFDLRLLTQPSHSSVGRPEDCF